MQETEPEEITYENKRKRQLIFIFLVALSPILLWLFAYAYARAMLSLKIARLEAAGIPTTPESLRAQTEAALPRDGDPNGKRIVEFLYGLKKEDFKTSVGRKSAVPLFQDYLGLNEDIFSLEWDDAVKTEARTVLDENAELLASVREIIRLPLMHPTSDAVYAPIREKNQSGYMDMNISRGILSLLELESLDAAYRGDLDTALEAHAQMYKWIRHYETLTPFMLNVMVGCAMRNMVCENIALLLLRFPFSQEQYEKFAALLGESGPVYRMRDAIKLSRIEIALGYKAYASGEVKPEHFANLPKTFMMEYRMPAVRAYLLMDEAAMLEGLAAVETAMQGYEERPWAYIDTLMNDDFTKTWLPFPIADKLIQSFGRGVTQELNPEVIRRLTLLALALKLHHLAHAAYPESLEELAPAFLESLPIDPFNGKPLKYMKTDTGFKVWSVSDNLVDDGGDRDMRDTSIIGFGGDIVLELAK